VTQISNLNAPHTPPTVLRPPRVARLDTVAAWRREVALLYRSMRKGELPSEVGSRLAFVAKIGAQLTQIEQELRQAVVIAGELRRLNAESVPQLTAPRVPLDATALSGPDEVASS
jgi:hypothetical protein